MNCWIFTFGFSKELYGDMARKAVKVYANSYSEAREKMCAEYGTSWAFQYSEDEWKWFEENPERQWEMEEIVRVIK